jgi:hypothetical protein
MMERLIPTSMTGTMNATYRDPMVQYLNYITSKGAYAIIDPHNFGRYYNNIITDYTGFQAFWKSVATLFKSNDKIIFDCNNEPHDMGSASVNKLMQACINGIRSADATSQYIFVEGTSYTGAWTWYFPLFPTSYHTLTFSGSPPEMAPIFFLSPTLRTKLSTRCTNTLTLTVLVHPLTVFPPPSDPNVSRPLPPGSKPTIKKLSSASLLVAQTPNARMLLRIC